MVRGGGLERPASGLAGKLQEAGGAGMRVRRTVLWMVAGCGLAAKANAEGDAAAAGAGAALEALLACAGGVRSAGGYLSAGQQQCTPWTAIWNRVRRRRRTRAGRGSRVWAGRRLRASWWSRLTRLLGAAPRLLGLLTLGGLGGGLGGDLGHLLLIA